MAEYAQRSIEEMLVEVDRMRKIKLFTTEETRAMMKKRKRFEYKMQRRTKEKEVYLQYIQYEKSILDLIAMRRKRKHIDLSRDEIDKSIALRIYKLFRIACFRFKNDVKLWLTHIDFARSNMDRERVSKIFTTMLQVHNKKPNLWIMAAKFEFEENESIETARNLFQRALRFLPACISIWVEYFRMELLCVEAIMKRRELLGLNKDDEDNKVEDAILGCKIVEIVFESAVAQVEKDEVIKLIDQMVTIAHEFKFTENLIEKMFGYVSTEPKFSKNEEAVDLLCRRRLHEEREILKKCESTGQVADFMIADNEQKVREAFQKALSDLETERMHRFYIGFCLERLKMNSKFLTEERFGHLNDAFTNMSAKFQVPLDLALEWIDTLIKFAKLNEAEELIAKYLEANPSNLTLWRFKLTLKIDQTNKSNERALVDLFQKAVKCVKQKESLELWKTMLNWAILYHYEKIESLFQEGAQIMVNEVATFVRIKHLNWALQSLDKGGIAKARKIYETYRNTPPFSLDFYYRYIEIEKCLPKPDENRIGQAYEDALENFGKQEPDLWLSYIDFKQKLAAGNKSPDAISNIYWKAMKQLDESLADEFAQKFCLAKNDPSILDPRGGAESPSPIEVD